MPQDRSVARHEGDPLLGKEGMEAIRALRSDQEAIPIAEDAHTAKVASIDERIAELEAERTQLVRDHNRSATRRSGEISNNRSKLNQAVTEEGEGTNPIYATALRAVVNSEPRRGLSLSEPSILKMADTNGRSMVALDELLRSTDESQPTLLIEHGIEGYHFDANIFLAPTIPGEGIKPTTSIVPQIHYEGGGRYMGVRDAWSLPVDTAKIAAFHIDSDTQFTSRDSLMSLVHAEAPGLQEEIQATFELIAEQGNNTYAVVPQPVISFDKDGKIETVEVALEDGSSRYHEIAIGYLSVKKALKELHKKYLAKTFGEKKEATDHDLLFKQLGKFARGEMDLPAQPYLIPSPIN